MTDLTLMLKDYRLTTAEILYHLPDHPGLLQTFLWQNYDIAPKYPILFGFLGYWADNLDGKLHSVMVASRKLILPADWRATDAWLTVQ
jgi:uncharacterized protein Usg